MRGGGGGSSGGHLSEVGRKVECGFSMRGDLHFIFVDISMDISMDMYLLCTFSPIGIRATKNLAQGLGIGGAQNSIGSFAERPPCNILGS